MLEIKKIPLDKTIDIIKKFEENIDKWSKNLLQDECLSDEWNKKLDSTYEIILLMKYQGKQNENTSLFAAYYEGNPVGLMDLSQINGKEPKIDLLVTHPGSSGVGGILIEKAVNISNELGHRGKISLKTPYKEAKEIYQSLGFKKNHSDVVKNIFINKNSSNTMNKAITRKVSKLHLSPKNAERWELDENTQWKLQSSNKKTRKTKK